MLTRIIQKIITCEVKEISDRVLEFTGSTETRDRVGDIIRAEGWNLENYLKNPVFLWAHDYHALPIGKSVKTWVQDKRLKHHVQFPTKEEYEFADTVYKLYKGGYLKAVSVGFKPNEFKEFKDEGGYGTEYIKQELYELSGCPVPANPDALIVARNAGLITVKEFEAVNKPEENENYFRVPVPKEEGKHEGHRIRTIDISEKEGIKALYCGECKVVITYLFSKEEKFGWTMAKAEAWVKEHSKAFTQEQIKDEIDYLRTMIGMVGLHEDNKREIKRLAGADIPVQIYLEIPKPVVPTQAEIAEALQREIERRFSKALARVKGKI